MIVIVSLSVHWNVSVDPIYVKYGSTIHSKMKFDDRRLIVLRKCLSLTLSIDNLEHFPATVALVLCISAASRWGGHSGPSVSAAFGGCSYSVAAGNPARVEDQGGSWENAKGCHQSQKCIWCGRPTQGLKPQAGEIALAAAGTQCQVYGYRKGHHHW